MLTIAYLFFETWRALWRPRRGAITRKSSFRTRQILPQTVDKQQQPQPQQEQHQGLSNRDTPSASEAAVSAAPQHQQQQLQQTPSQSSNSPGGERKFTNRSIPIPAKQIVPSVSRQTQSSIQPQTSSSVKASPPSPSQIPRQQQQQHQQHQQQQQQSLPPGIPPPTQKSVKTLILEPSISGNRMDEVWANKQMEKFSFGFAEADKDKSGSLSLDEVINVLKKQGFNGSDTEAKFIFGQMDKDGSHCVSKDEFEAAMRDVPKMTIREFVFRKAFLQMDKDGSGKLSKEEIMDATKNEGGIEVGHKIVSDLLIYLDKEDDDGQVRYDEFLRVLNVDETATVMYRIFKAMDKDGSGFLTRTEMMDGLSNEFELKLSAKKIATLLIDLGRDNDGKINFDEFVDSWLKKEKSAKK